MNQPSSVRRSGGGGGGSHHGILEPGARLRAAAWRRRGQPLALVGAGGGRGAMRGGLRVVRWARGDVRRRRAARRRRPTVRRSCEKHSVKPGHPGSDVERGRRKVALSSDYISIRTLVTYLRAIKSIEAARARGCRKFRRAVDQFADSPRETTKITDTKATSRPAIAEGPVVAKAGVLIPSVTTF